MIGIAALLGCVLCWGVVPVMLRDLVDVVDAWTANGFRYPLAAVLYWPFLWQAWRKREINASLLRACAVPAMLALAAQVFWALAHYHLQASEIGFLVRFSMVWSLLAALTLFRDERRLLAQPRFYLGLALSVGGFVVLSLMRGTASVSGSGTGLAIVSLCSLLFGLYAVSVRLYMNDVHPVLAFSVVSQFVSVGTLSGMFWRGNVHQLGNLAPRDWLLMVSSSILGIAVGHILMYASVQRLGAALTTGCQSLTPFITATVASLTLGEVLSPWQWAAGVVLILGAVVLLSVRVDLAR